MRRIITILFLLNFGSLLAQETQLQQAENHFRAADYDSAMKMYEEASDGFHEAGDLDNYAACNLKIAECHLSMGEPKFSLVVAESTQSFLKALLPENTELQAKALKISGNGHLNTGRNDLAIENLKLAADLFKNESLDAASCFEDLGIAYWNNGNRELALQYHERALQIREEVKSDQVLIGDSFINIGLIYLESQPMQGILYFDKALDIYKSELSNKHPKLAYAYSDLAFAHAHLENYFRALEYLDLVEEIWKASIDGDHPNKAYTLSNRGRILEMKGDFNEALVFQQEALKMYLRIYGDKHPDIANTFFLIGSVYQKKSEFKSALEYYQRSIYANLMDQQFESIYDLPEIRDYYSADILLSSLQAKAKSQEAEHFERTLKMRDIDGALEVYLLCDELISQIRQLRHSEGDKLRLGSIATDVYENGINLSLYLSQRSWKKKKYLELAFNFCERSKSAILLEAINETNAKAFGGIPREELNLEDSLKNEISFYKLELARAKTPDQEVKAKNNLFKYQSANRSFIERMESNYPEYFKLKYNQELASTNEIQNNLTDDASVLSYFTGENNIYVFVITKKRLNVQSMTKLPDFEKQVKGLRNAIFYKLDEEYKSSARVLYDQLIPKINPAINKMVVIPDGILGTIPFEVLTAESDNSGKSKMLIEDFRVSYDFSATLLLDRMDLTTKLSTEGILLAAPLSFEKNDVSLSDLPDTENEVKEIKYLFMGENMTADVMLGEEANELLLKSGKIADYRFLHFATHGLVNQSQPELSRIFVAPCEGEDGSLYAGEIYNIKINADLVALSACETGLGKIAKGEGVVGLSRALMYAGAENIMVSLWPVADESTAEMMIDFYKHHLIHSENNVFSDDLRSAKLNLIKSGTFDHPYYWAPFILVGL